MNVLAIAKRNEGYRWKDTFKKCIIEAVLENGSVSFLEYYNSNVNTLPEETIRSLFHREGETITKKDLPFLIDDNVDFYTILNRKQEEYKEKYLEILRDRNKPKIIRTTQPKKKTIKRTK